MPNKDWMPGFLSFICFFFFIAFELRLTKLKAAPSSQKPGPTNLLNHQLHQHRQLQQTAPPAPLPQRGIRMQMQLEKAMVMGENGTSNKSNECFCKLHLNYPLSVWPLCNPHFSSSQPTPPPPSNPDPSHAFIHLLAGSFICCVWCRTIWMGGSFLCMAATWTWTHWHPWSRQRPTDGSGKTATATGRQSGSNSQS